jgi:hypothetical protein
MNSSLNCRILPRRGGKRLDGFLALVSSQVPSFPYPLRSRHLSTCLCRSAVYPLNFSGPQPVSSWLNSESCLEANVFSFGSLWICFLEHEATLGGDVTKNWGSQVLGNTEEPRRNAFLQHGESERDNVEA